jgi:hypothetical protein
MHRLTLKATLFAIGTACSLVGRAAEAQTPALASPVPKDPVIVYSQNESGGLVSLSFPGADSTALEDYRLRLFELAAAIRRGDFRAVRIFQPGHPAVQVLAQQRAKLRCTLRSTGRSAELVLLSDDDEVVAAIHQILSTSPPRVARL